MLSANVLESQLAQWVSIENFASPYPDDDRELARVLRVIERRLGIAKG